MGCCQEVVDSIFQVGLYHIQSPGCIGLWYHLLYPLSAFLLLEHAEEKVVLLLHVVVTVDL